MNTCKLFGIVCFQIILKCFFESIFMKLQNLEMKLVNLFLQKRKRFNYDSCPFNVLI